MKSYHRAESVYHRDESTDHIKIGRVYDRPENLFRTINRVSVLCRPTVYVCALRRGDKIKTSTHLSFFESI